MQLDTKKEGTTLFVRVLAQRIDGDNEIVSGLRAQGWFEHTLTALEVDLEQVQFINSLGITEIVNIHRQFSESNPDGFQLALRNVDKKVNAILELVEIDKIAKISPKT